MKAQFVFLATALFLLAGCAHSNNMEPENTLEAWTSSYETKVENHNTLPDDNGDIDDSFMHKPDDISSIRSIPDTDPPGFIISIQPECYTYENDDTSTDIMIVYPQISGYTDESIETRINQQLKDIAWGDISATEEGLNYNVQYDDYPIAGRFLCVRYYIQYYHQSAAHPWRDMVCIMLDLKTGQKLELTDIMVVDERLLQKLVDRAFDVSLSQIVGLDDGVLESCEYEDFYRQIDSSGAFTLDENAVGFIVGVPHSVGDYWLLSFPYDIVSELFHTWFAELVTASNKTVSSPEPYCTELFETDEESKVFLSDSLIIYDELYNKGELCATYRMELPQFVIKSNHDSMDKINSFYKQQYQEGQEKIKTHMGGLLDSLKEIEQSSYCFYLECEFSVMVLTRYINVLNYSEEDFGWFHPQEWVNADVFDRSNGDKVSLSALFSVNEEVYLVRLSDEIYTAFRKNSDYRDRYSLYGTNEKEEREQMFYVCKDSIIDGNFYLEEDGIVLLFNNYEIASYSAGPTWVKIPYTCIEDILM